MFKIMINGRAVTNGDGLVMHFTERSKAVAYAARRFYGGDKFIVMPV